LARPVAIEASNDSRIETHTYVVDARLVSYWFDEQANYRLVLESADGQRMHAVIPHPDCVAGTSPSAIWISGARALFDRSFRAGYAPKSASTSIRVHGMGFFGSLPRRTDAPPSGFELHPVLKVEFSPTTTIGSDASFRLKPVDDRLFDWAEATYPGYFPAPGQSGASDGYVYRYYAKTGTYVGTAAGRVFVHNGRDWNLLQIGLVDDFLDLATKVGY
jgi:hypothetical protein